MDGEASRFDIGGITPRQLIALVVLSLALVGVIVFQMRGPKRKVAPNVQSSQSVAELVAQAKKLKSVKPGAGAPNAPGSGSIDLVNFDATQLVLKDGHVRAGKYPRISLDPFVISPEIELAYRALAPAERAKSKAARPARPAAPRPSPPPPLNLAATVVDGTEKVAILNGRVVGVGERIDGYELVDVAARWAKLRRDGREYVVRMKENR